ncbi:ThiF family adenylyltransferase [Draconibacterium sp. IB214405]|uniref:ThiF family adenylyltransferase n=1 Tax=Draconibacterium sp. IB214405 TaxID=3097352 RepID=UPI002A14D39D|nr:ThiF family adenylyltransferase [Draconibacterium sp. IB214405]MDX8339767.1 ThiF family adenylyltransferase [Draconibacterium sp. IB214405]
METHEWHKHPSFKNLFESEIDILKRGLKGDFELIEYHIPTHPNEKVTAIGELKFGTNQKQIVQILFPPKYPFAPPKVISIQGELVDNKLPALMQVHHFGKGNQYDDGSMCLFRKDFWNKEIHNVGWTLRRAQKWLSSANTKEGFKPDEVVEEYLPPIRPIGQVIIPTEISMPDNALSGDFFLTQFKPNYYILEQNKSVQSTFKLSLGVESFRWYAFEAGMTFKKLFPVFNAQRLVDIFSNFFGLNIVEKGQNRNIAFYLPDDENPWHFFKLNIQQNGLQVNIVHQYFIGRTVSNELYLRTKDIFDNELLSQKRVTIIGLGAIGSEVALSLAKNGVGHFNLFDMDTFEIGNSVRHAADLFYIGEHKVNVAKQLILRSNPNITVNTFNVDVLNDTGLLENSFSKSDLCIILTAEDSVEYLINDYYQKNYNIPFIFSRASMGAFSGAIQVVDSQSACLKCLSLYNADTLPKPISKIKLAELPPEYGSCSSPALPGSEIDTKEIALQVSRVAMQCLLKGEKSTYPSLRNKQYYWHGPHGSSEKEPFTWEMKNIKKHKDCPICH